LVCGGAKFVGYLVAAAELEVHLVEIVLVVVLPGDALLFVLVLIIRRVVLRGGAVVLLVPGDNRDLLRARPDLIVVQSLAAVDLRPCGHDGAVGELLNAEPLGAEASFVVADLAVGLLNVVLDVGPGEAERPVEPVESEEARVGRIRVLEVALEALAVLAEALAELAELVGLGGIRLDIEGSRADQRLGECEEARAVRHFVLNKRYDQLFEGTNRKVAIRFNFFQTLNRLYRGPNRL